MRRKEKELTDPEAIAAIFEQAQVCHLAMVDDGSPYVVPLNFGYRDNALYIHCALEGRKISILRKNPRVCFALHTGGALIPADKPCAWSTNFESIIGDGVAHILTDTETKVEAFNVIMSHYSEGPFTFNGKAVDKSAIIRVDIESLSAKKS